MKKLVAILFFLTYSLATIGATISHHFCMGKMVDVSILSNNKTSCSKCGMARKAKKTKKSCCQEKSTTVKITQPHQKVVQEFYSFLQDFEATLPQQTSFVNTTTATIIKLQNFSISTTVQYPKKLYILHCTYLI